MVDRQREVGSGRFIGPTSSVGAAGTVADEKRLAKRVAVLLLPLLLLVLAEPLPLLVSTDMGGGMYCNIPAEFSGSTNSRKM